MNYHKGLLLAAIHLGIVFSLAGKYAIDREHLPRVWAKAAPYDPNLPIRGRYVRLQLDREAVIDANGKKTAAAQNNRQFTEPIPFFIPEHIPDPSVRRTGEELWVEVSLPRSGPPRPIRLGVRKSAEEAIEPLIIQ
jgi:hypothetical protein